MSARSRVLLLIPHLGGGGAEQVTALLARKLSREKYETHLGLVTQRGAGEEFMPPWIAVHGLGARRVRAGALGIVRLVWQLRPAVILSGMAHLNFLVLLLRPLFPLRTRILVRQNGSVSPAIDPKDLPVQRLVYRILYRHAYRVICQSNAMAEDISTAASIPRDRIAVLANPVDVDAIRATASATENYWTGPGPNLLAVGRLSHEKGFDLLLRAFAAVRRCFPNASFAIAGAGRCESALKAESRALGLDAAVRFLGHVPNPAAFFPGASLFVLPSRSEGIPNALLEAAAAGLPLVALPASAGLVDLLGDQPGVWLAHESSAQALSALLMAALDALRPAQRFPHAWIEQFRMDRAVAAYEDLIDATIDGRCP